MADSVVRVKLDPDTRQLLVRLIHAIEKLQPPPIVNNTTFAESPSEENLTNRLAEACPGATDPNHRIGPEGYNARADWADQMVKTHTQSQCPTCGLWVIWTPKT